MPLILDSNLALGSNTATQLSLYNGALRNLKERKLASLTENREPRRVLDDVWAGALSYVLEQGLWNFASRTSKFTPNPSYTAAFGYQNQFVKPDDFVRLVGLYSDPYGNIPLNQYTDEAGAWYSDSSEIYVTYISNDASYGTDFTRWPQTFTKYVEAYLAFEAGPRITGKDDESLSTIMTKALRDARSKDAMNEPTKFLPQGSWVSARTNGSNGNIRKNRGSLIG